MMIRVEKEQKMHWLLFPKHCDLTTFQIQPTCVLTQLFLIDLLIVHKRRISFNPFWPSFILFLQNLKGNDHSLMVCFLSFAFFNRTCLMLKDHMKVVLWWSAIVRLTKYCTEKKKGLQNTIQTYSLSCPPTVCTCCTDTCISYAEVLGKGFLCGLWMLSLGMCGFSGPKWD